MSNMDQLYCTNSNTAILLFNLRLQYGTSRTLSRHQKKHYFEYTYQVEYLVFSKSRIRIDQKFFGVHVHSESIAKWIGNTNKQENIVNAFHNKKISIIPDEDFNEFMTPVHGGVIGVDYPTSIYYNSPEFKAGVAFPPILHFRSNNEINAIEYIDVINNIICLFSFLTFGSIKISKIELLYGGRFGAQKVTMLIPKNDSIVDGSRYILYPLGRNLRHDSLGLPEFPDIAFVNFFSKDCRNIVLISRYIKYSTFENIEERFLGFFRLLETVTHKKRSYLDENILLELCEKTKPYLIRKFNDKKSVSKFIERIPDWNMSKYNTEKCINDLLKEIPNSETSKWIYGAKDMAKICKLRNDITHANHYDCNLEKMRSYAAFIEVLLVYSMLVKLGVSADSAITICRRIHCYELIITKAPR